MNSSDIRTIIDSDIRHIADQVRKGEVSLFIPPTEIQEAYRRGVIATDPQ